MTTPKNYLMLKVCHREQQSQPDVDGMIKINGIERFQFHQYHWRSVWKIWKVYRSNSSWNRKCFGVDQRREVRQRVYYGPLARVALV